MKTKSCRLFPTAVISLFLPGCTHGPGMRGWGHMMGYGGYGGILMWIILIVIAAVVIYFVVNQSRAAGDSMTSPDQNPVEILKRRYARGEISREEFDRIKSEIEG